MALNYHTITFDRAILAVRAYNEGFYGCLKNPDLDERACAMFVGGLGSTSEKIEEQVKFIGKDYGGAAGFKAAYSLIPHIAHDIFENRMEFDRAAVSALPLLTRVPSPKAVEILYRPFVKPLHGKRYWQVWATKFWHFLNSNAFPIEDSRVDKFFVITEENSVYKYVKFADRFRDFIRSHQDWLPHLRRVDEGADAVPCSENKLWDKMLYGLEDLERNRR